MKIQPFIKDTILFVMAELNDFAKRANANENFCFNVSTIEPPIAADATANNVVMPPLESFDSKHMNRAWMVCWGTTTIILLFLLLLWVYFEATNDDY